MICRVEQSLLSGTIRCPPSKSYTHRAVFLASLAEGKSTIYNALRSADTEATIQACRQFGALVSGAGSEIAVEGTCTVRPAEIYAANSGTTIRIAAAIAALAAGKSTLSGDDSLSRRPMQPLEDALNQLGAKCSSDGGRPPLEVTGPITGSAASIQGNISSQFVSGLIIAGPLAPGGIDISIDAKAHGPLVSKEYVKYTIQAAEAFGARTTAGAGSYSCRHGRYAAADVLVPADSSILALLYSAAALAGDGLAIEDEAPEAAGAVALRENKRMEEILGEMGAKVGAGPKRTVQCPDGLRGCDISLADDPDLLPPVAILSLISSGPVRITGIGHARHKETDRVQALKEELSKAGVGVRAGADCIELERDGPLRPAEFDARRDHRLFMALCIAGMHIGGCTVSDPESAAVSYPGFVSDMRGCGGRIDPPVSEPKHAGLA